MEEVEQKRAHFYSNPYSFVKGFVDREKGWSLKEPMKDLH